MKKERTVEWVYVIQDGAYAFWRKKSELSEWHKRNSRIGARMFLMEGEHYDYSKQNSNPTFQKL